MVKCEETLVKKNLDKDAEIKQLREYIDKLLSLPQEDFLEYQVNKIVADLANSRF
jgi:hypothetical protein